MTFKPAPARTPRSAVAEAAGAAWRAHKAVLLMLGAQLLSSITSAAAKVLQTETDEAGLSPTQVVFTMAAAMAVLSGCYMRALRTPDAPLGPPAVRRLLLARGVAGFFGIWGYYGSLRVLPVSEATVINFLAPLLAALAGAALLRAPFTRRQRLAALASFAGVVLVAKPWHIVWPHQLVCEGAGADNSTLGGAEAGGGNGSLALLNCTIDGRPVGGAGAAAVVLPSPVEHALAIGVALVGVAGGAAGFVALAWIGDAAHPMVSVAYFAVCTAVLTAASAAFLPPGTFRLPRPPEVALLAFQCLCGFAMHLAITASLAGERSSRALNMVYSQIVFALLVDRLVWGTTPGPVSLLGGALILASVLAVALRKDDAQRSSPERERVRHPEEDVELMAAGLLDDDEDEDGEDLGR